MALYKEVTTDFGFSVNYWKLTSFDIDNVKKKAHITVSPYISKEARESGASPIYPSEKLYYICNYDYSGTPYEGRTNMEFDNNFTAEIIAQTKNGVYSHIYNWLKTLPDFEGATDI